VSQIQLYIYPTVVPPVQEGTEPTKPTVPSTLEHLWGTDPRHQDKSGISEDQLHQCIARAREEGLQEGAARARAEYENQLVDVRQAVLQALQTFSHEREEYFGRIEGEVVGLAIAIARKILHREAQVDPLLLAGVVRVGLEKVSLGTRVRLRVPPDQVAVWQEFFTRQPDLQPTPELMGDASLSHGHCLLETELGSTDLALETQLKEIEQGFFDLLAQRPRKSA
jgi:flagellar assembly protein FliH